MAKTWPPWRRKPRCTNSCTQYTRLLAMTSRVISICLGATCSSGVETKGRRLPKAREWRTTFTEAPDSPKCSAIVSRTAVRFAGSAALALIKTAWRPAARTSAAAASAEGRVARVSRCTPKMLRPERASSAAVARPKPLEAPSTKAQSARSIAKRQLLSRAPRPRGPPQR